MTKAIVRVPPAYRIKVRDGCRTAHAAEFQKLQRFLNSPYEFNPAIPHVPSHPL